MKDSMQERTYLCTLPPTILPPFWVSILLCTFWLPKKQQTGSALRECRLKNIHWFTITRTCELQLYFSIPLKIHCKLNIELWTQSQVTARVRTLCRFWYRWRAPSCSDRVNVPNSMYSHKPASIMTRQQLNKNALSPHESLKIADEPFFSEVIDKNDF